MIEIQCACGKKLRVRDELAGKRVKCPGCGVPVRVEDEDDLLTGLNDAIAMEMDCEEIDVDTASDLASRGGKNLTETLFSCPQCDNRLHRAAKNCPQCNLSFREGHCAVCGEWKKQVGKSKCKCTSRVVVWVKENKKGYCTNCSRMLPVIRRPALRFLPDVTRCCPRCALDSLLRLDRETADGNYNNPYQRAMASSVPVSSQKFHISDETRLDRARDEREKLKQKFKSENAKVCGSAMEGGCLGVLLGIPLLGLFAGAAAQKKVQAKQAKNLKKSQKIFSLMLSLNKITEFEYATRFEKFVAKYLTYTILGFFAAMVLLGLTIEFLINR